VTPVAIRQAEPQDHARVLAVLDEWWGGRQMRDMLPKLFFLHFRETSFVAERDGELAGFLVGFLSQSEPADAYVHFVGVGPAERGWRDGRG
jgi:predicted GNAT superfamily acetyltransferase